MKYQLLIGGELVDGDRTLDVIDPATAQVFERCACASERDLDRAIEAAHAAFPAWASTSLEARQQVLLKMADAMDARGAEVQRLLTQEQGKPLGDSAMEVGGVSYLLRHYASLDIPVRVIEDSETRRVELHRKPLGVVAAIVPWNYPVFMAAMKFAAALLAGNTVVLKPAPTTPLSSLLMGMIFKDVVPAGVFNVIVDRNDLGARLTSHPLVRKVSFTGSTGTGMKVMASAAPTLKRLTLELGGNDAGIVLDDCDPRLVAQRVFDAAFANNGQLCVALKRLYVHESLYDAVCDELVRIAGAAKVGPGLEADTRLGPVQNRDQYEKVLALIEETRGVGKIIAGGDRPAGAGYFINPTIVRDIREGARLVDEEQFGPVVPVIRYSDLDEVIERANATGFGLGNSVWSSNPERAAAVAARLESGTVWINQHGDTGPTIPFAGAKLSGMGAEYAEEGLAELTQIKVVNRAKQAAI
ncbi:aldehyde dehydrogenase family protein [Hydrocarboniphaga effusa]|uniref:aldehyde dehydrogenase family protein n=1 Tax=Hydrocarboniphaga effusa TaxID=243629 RepID=UPI003BAD0B45